MIPITAKDINQKTCEKGMFDVDHYENTPIQMYRKFHLQKLKISDNKL